MLSGVDVIVLDNGKLQITVVPTRGLGILSVTMGNVRLGWDSPVKEVVHPRRINLQSRGGLGWLEEGKGVCCLRGTQSDQGRPSGGAVAILVVELPGYACGDVDRTRASRTWSN